MGKTYDPNVDYMKKMEEAAAKGDYEQAAYYEEKRNEKIKGEGLSQYTLSHKYESYLPVTTQKKMEDIFKKLEAREPFSYDIQGDKLYAQYRDQYTEAGARAREDAVAQAATLTGGYGNSYGMTLGQDAFDREMERLESLVPQLYDNAKKAYEAEGDALLDQYEALAKDLEQEQKVAMEEKKLDYQKELDALEREAEKQAASAKAEKEAQEKAYSLALSMLKEGLMPSRELLGLSGIKDADANALYSANQPNTVSKGSSTVQTKTEKETDKDPLKTLSNTMWEKLSNSYRAGQQKGELTDFFQLRSMMEAQGYDVKAFDTWARQTYGKDYTTGGEKTINWESVLALGYGPIGEEKLRELLASGQIEQYTQGDYIYYKKAKTTPALPKGYGG